jgi:hypothetical protein
MAKFMPVAPTPSGQKKTTFKGDMYSSGKGDVGKPGGPGGIGGKKMAKHGGKKH